MGGAGRGREKEGVNFKQGDDRAQAEAGTDGFCHRNSRERLEEPAKDKSSFQMQAGLYPEGRTVSWGVGCAKCPQKRYDTNSQSADLIQ